MPKISFFGYNYITILSICFFLTWAVVTYYDTNCIYLKFSYLGNNDRTVVMTTVMTWMGLTSVFCITQYGFAGWSNVNQMAWQTMAKSQKKTKLRIMVNHCGQICQIENQWTESTEVSENQSNESTKDLRSCQNLKITVLNKRNIKKIKVLRVLWARKNHGHLLRANMPTPNSPYLT